MNFKFLIFNQYPSQFVDIYKFFIFQVSSFKFQVSRFMNFSLIGAGFIMPRHAEAIYATDGKIIDIVNTAYSDEKWREAVENPQVDCIVILTPNYLHFDIAMAAVENNKIVLCEKPLTINSEQAQILSQKNNIFTVLQLRHHHLVKRLKSEINNNNNYKIEMDISVYRDEKYYQSWKGQNEKSGGLLFNLGIHYFDLLLYLFGEPIKCLTDALDEKIGAGIIKGINYECRWRVSTDENQDNQRRVFKINGIDYNFSSKDNLSYENLHREVYQDLLKGKGVLPKEALRSIELVEKLYNTYQII